MSKKVLEDIARQMVFFDSGHSSFFEGGFTAFTCLLDDFGYTFARSGNSLCIIDSIGNVVCSVPR